jgi:hypothetical protein
VSKIVAHISTAVGGDSSVDRARQQILNLIDLNVIPINVHALMRGTPLANLYNYEFTFEQMVASLYGEDPAKYTNTSADFATKVDGIKKTKQLFIHMLVDPYLDFGEGRVRNKIYGNDARDLGTAGFVHRIFRGDADQVFNKALFGSLYRSRNDYDEAGPGVGSGISRGRASASRSDLPGGALPSIANIIGNTAALGTLIASGAATAIDLAGPAPDQVYQTFRGVCQELANDMTKFRNDIGAAMRSRGLFYHNGLLVSFNDMLNAHRPLMQYINANSALVGGVLVDLFRYAENTVMRAVGAFIVEHERGALVGEARSDPNAHDYDWVDHDTHRLTYLDDKGKVAEVYFGPGIVETLNTIGQARFDTRLVRNLFFISNVHRLVRLKLNRELTKSRNVLVSSHSAVDPSVTEYGADPFGPNEVIESTTPDGMRRFDDED